jgi:hypothetical protein
MRYRIAKSKTDFVIQVLSSGKCQLILVTWIRVSPLERQNALLCWIDRSKRAVDLENGYSNLYEAINNLCHKGIRKFLSRI